MNAKVVKSFWDHYSLDNWRERSTSSSDYSLCLWTSVKTLEPSCTLKTCLTCLELMPDGWLVVHVNSGTNVRLAWILQWNYGTSKVWSHSRTKKRRYPMCIWHDAVGTSVCVTDCWTWSSSALLLCLFSWTLNMVRTTKKQRRCQTHCNLSSGNAAQMFEKENTRQPNRLRGVLKKNVVGLSWFQVLNSVLLLMMHTDWKSETI